MRTTLDLDERVMRQAKRRALDEGKTLTRFIEDALRERLRAGSEAPSGFRFRPLTKSGVPVPGVDLEDRDSLYERMEGRA